MEQKKRIRIFISSTFKDMQKERDIIVQEVLLPLRAEAERRGGSLSWVDLRWGIRPGTDTEMVIRTCLSEIEDCHPFFIGLVGHRYGWSPTINGKLEERLNRQFRDTEELFSHKRSLTEIEMRYNLLLSKEKGRNYFYFSGDTPKISILGRILRYCINRGKEPSLIADLRTYIKDEYKRNVPEYSIMCNQDDKRHLKKLVYADIKHIVDEIFPETPVPEAMAVRYHQENFYNAQDGFLSRERILTEIRDWIDTPLAKDDSKMKCLLLKGNSGVGKTTMLATLLHNSSHNIKFLYHFVGASMKRESPVLILRDLLNQTYSKEELSSLTKNVSDNIYELCDILQQRILNDVKAKVIVVIDNIDAIECSKETLVSLFDWLPTKLPNTKYILSSSSEWRHLKGDLSPVDMTELIIPELTIIERKDYASIFLVKEYRKDINQGKRFSDLLLDERNQYLSNPRMLKMFLDEISILGLYGDELDKKVKQITCDSSQLLDNIFNRLEKKTCGIAKVRKILLSIALTDYGLQENDIVDICNDEKVKLKPEDWSILHWNIKPYLQNNGSIAFQKFFRDAVLHRYSNDENMSKEQLRLAQRLEFMYKEQNRHYESEFLNLYSKSNEDDLYRCLADPHILSYLYNNDKDKLFDYLLQLKKHGYIDYFTKDIVASVSTLTEEEKIEIFEMLSTIFCNIIPIYTVAIDAEENTIKILEAKNDFSVEGKKRLAQNYLNEVKLLTIVFKLLEAEASYKRFRDYISSIEIGDEYEALYYDGLVAQANIYYAHPDFEEKKKAIPLYKMTITYFEGKGIYIKTIDLLYNLAMLCGYNGDNNTLSECNMRLKEIVSTHCKYGSHLYFASLYKQMDCERLLLPTSGYEDYIKRLKNQIDNIKDMYGGVCNEICEFYLNIGTEYDAIARSYWKEKNIPMFIANAKETESYYGLFLETVEKLHETDSNMYADGLHSYANSFQNFISLFYQGTYLCALRLFDKINECYEFKPFATFLKQKQYLCNPLFWYINHSKSP